MENDQLMKKLNISDIFIKLFLDLKPAETELGRFYKNVKQVMSLVKKDVQGAFDPIYMAFDFLISAAEYGADEVKKITEGAEKSRIDISEFSILANIFKMLGGNADEAGLELKNISDQVEAMRNEAAKDISLGGITVSLYDDENNLKKPKQIFQDIQKELWKIQDASKRANIIENMGFGRTMSKLLNLDESAYLRKEMFAKKRGIVSPEHQSGLNLYNEASARISQHYDQFASDRMSEIAVLLDAGADALDYLSKIFTKFKDEITLIFISVGSAALVCWAKVCGAQMIAVIMAGIPYLASIGIAALAITWPFLALGASIATCVYWIREMSKDNPFSVIGDAFLEVVTSFLEFKEALDNWISEKKVIYFLKAFQFVAKLTGKFPPKEDDKAKEKTKDQEYTSMAIPPMAPLQTPKEMENNYASSVNSNTADNSKTTNISQENKIYVTVKDVGEVKSLKGVLDQQVSALV